MTIAAPAATGPLSSEQVQRFDREGYLVVEDVFSATDLQPLIAEITAEIDRLTDQYIKAGKLSRSYGEYDFEHRLAMINRETDEIARAIWNGVLSGPAVFNVIRHGKLLDIAEQFVGPEIIASSVYRLRPKVPHHAMGPVPWHQDSGYTEPFCDRHLMITVWLALADATEENGCMWVLPRQHKTGVFEHVGRKNRSYLVIPERALPGGDAVCCPVKRGGVLLLTNLAPHASFENNTDAVRWSMDMRYQSATLPTNYPMTRLAGEVDPRKQTGVPMACYPPEADCLIRSQARPNEVVRDAATFNRIRQSYQGPTWTNRWTAVEA